MNIGSASLIKQDIISHGLAKPELDVITEEKTNNDEVEASPIEKVNSDTKMMVEPEETINIIENSTTTEVKEPNATEEKLEDAFNVEALLNIDSPIETEKRERPLTPIEENFLNSVELQEGIALEAHTNGNKEDTADGDDMAVFSSSDDN